MVIQRVSVKASTPALPPNQDEALSVCLHKVNVYIDLSGWSPKYFPSQRVQYANTQA
jgi:predicted TIM-barrel fold metal-dependent hydrolase